MGNNHLIGVLLLLFVASSRSNENIAVEDTTTPIETVPLPSTGSPLVLQQEVETSAPPKVTSVPVAPEVSTSQKEPMTMSNGVASTTIITKDFKVTNKLSTPALTSLNDPSTTLKTVDMATIPAKEEVNGSESQTDDQSTASPSTTQNETHSTHNKGYVTEIDRKRDREEDFPTNKHPGQETNNDKLNQKKKGYGDLIKVILIGVGIFLLIFILATMIFFLMRKKKRSGSFRTQSKKNSKRDVWAGQVPQLGDERAAQDPTMAENGRAGTELETVKEEEMVTFVTGEKKTDSVIEMNELGAGEKATANGGEKLGNGDTAEEKTPLLEEASEESPKPDEQFPVPPMEQELMANGVQ